MSACLCRTLPALVCLATVPAASAAQLRPHPTDRRFWLAGAAVVLASAAIDEPLDRSQRAHRSDLLERVGDTGNVLGTGRYLIAGMAATWLAARATHRQTWADATLRVAAAYAAGNAIGSILKPAVGRHRPDSTEAAWRFHPGMGGDWHSFPSAHTLHAFTLADAITQETQRDWVAVASYSAAGLVAWSRTYRNQHWASDVTASAVLGIATSRTVGAWLRGRRHGQAGGAPWALAISTDSRSVVVAVRR